MYLVEQNYPSLMVEHVNDIIQRIQFLLSLAKPGRPNSSIKNSSKKSNCDSISKAHIHFDDSIKKDSVLKEISDQEILSKISEWSWIMNVKYFRQNNKTNVETQNEKFYKINKYTVQYDKFSNELQAAIDSTTEEHTNVEANNESEIKSSIKLSKGVIGYNTFKSIIMHIYRIIINRLVRTAHLADLSNNKNKGIIKIFIF